MHRNSFCVIIFTVLFYLVTIPLWAAGADTGAKTPRKNYPVLGIVIGSPSGSIDGVVGYSFGMFEARLSGGAGPTSFDSAELSWGIQGDLGIKAVDRPHFESEFSFFAAYSHFGNGALRPYYTYEGFAFNLNFYGLFFEGGLGLANGRSGALELSALADIFVPVLQIGYVHRFN